MLAIFVLFLSLEAAFLIAAAIYVSPLVGTRDRRAPPRDGQAGAAEGGGDSGEVEA